MFGVEQNTVDPPTLPNLAPPRDLVSDLACPSNFAPISEYPLSAPRFAAPGARLSAARSE